MSRTKLTVGVVMLVSGLVSIGFFWVARSYFAAIAQGAIPQRTPTPAKVVEQLAGVTPAPGGSGQPPVVFVRCRRICRAGLILGGLIALGGLYVAVRVPTEANARPINRDSEASGS